MDVRKLKTEKALVTALVSLLERKVWQKITIKDICSEAMVSRSTFYAHFEDKYALFEYMLDGMDEVVTEDLMRMDMREMLLTRFTKLDYLANMALIRKNGIIPDVEYAYDADRLIRLLIENGATELDMLEYAQLGLDFTVE